MWRRLSNGGDWITLVFWPSLGNYQVGSTIFERDLKRFFRKRHSDSLIYWEAVCTYILYYIILYYIILYYTILYYIILYYIILYRYRMIYSNIFEKPQSRQKKMERGPAVLLRSQILRPWGPQILTPSQYFILFESHPVFVGTTCCPILAG